MQYLLWSHWTYGKSRWISFRLLCGFIPSGVLGMFWLGSSTTVSVHSLYRNNPLGTFTGHFFRHLSQMKNIHSRKDERSIPKWTLNFHFEVQKYWRFNRWKLFKEIICFLFALFSKKISQIKNFALNKFHCFALTHWVEWVEWTMPTSLSRKAALEQCSLRARGLHWIKNKKCSSTHSLTIFSGECCVDALQ